MGDHDTKIKIIQTARKLFANKGFNATSIREIASTADVNLSAVNYHFTNKDNLFWEVFRAGYTELEAKFSGINVETMSVGDVSLKFYDVMQASWEDLQNTFRLILSGTLPEINEEHRSFCSGKSGPPGGAIFAAAIKREFGDDIPETGLLWASECLFSSLIHWALISGTAYLKEFGDNSSLLNSELMNRNILAYTSAITEHLVANKKSFE